SRRSVTRRVQSAEPFHRAMAAITERLSLASDDFGLPFPACSSQNLAVHTKGGHKWWPHADVSLWSDAPDQPKTPHLQGFQAMELGGLEPPTSWVRSRRSPN